MIIVPDVSFWQDDNSTPYGINFDVMHLAGAAGVIIRAGQNTWPDTDFKTNWHNARAAGLPRGSYWFYDSRISPKDQAALWIATMAGDLGELPLWCDFEDNYGGEFGTWDHWFQFLEQLKHLAPNKQLGIYTGYYYWIERTVQKNIPPASLDYFKQYPLWLAWYGSDPRIPKPWDNYTLWQFTKNGDGTKYGAESEGIDLSYYDGTEEEFKAEFRVGELPPIIDTGDKMPYSMTPIYNGTRLRPDHNVFNTAITSFNANVLLEGDIVWIAPADGNEVKAGDKWLHVTKAGGVNLAVAGWSALIHKGVPVCDNFKEIAAPPTTTDPVKPVFTVTVEAEGYKTATVDLLPE